MGRTHDQEFTAYVHASAAAMRRTAYLLCGDWQRAEDATQDTLVRLYGAWRRGDRFSSVDAYARRVLVNAVIDQGRRPWRREHVAPELPDVEVAESMPDVDDRLLVVAALRAVPPRQRACLVLRFYEDRSVEDTARILGVGTGTVKSQTARGLHALRAQLDARADPGLQTLRHDQGARS